MSGWAQSATSVSTAGWLDVFTRLQPGLLLCSGIYKNSWAITERCQAQAPENIGYLISAVKVSQAEFNKKSKVAKLDRITKHVTVCQALCTFLCARVTRNGFITCCWSCQPRIDFKAFSWISIGFCVLNGGFELIMLMLWVMAGFMPLWSVHLCCDCLCFGINLTACCQSVWPVTIDLSVISPHWLPEIFIVVADFTFGKCLLTEDWGKTETHITQITRYQLHQWYETIHRLLAVSWVGVAIGY